MAVVMEGFCVEDELFGPWQHYGAREVRAGVLCVGISYRL